MTHPAASIGLLDLDAFYLGVEMVCDPSLRGKAAAVGGGGSGNRGVVLSASYEARRAGVKSGMPLIEARRHCPQLLTVTPRHRLYQRASNAVFRRIREVTPTVQQVSVDEAYLDLAGTDRLLGCPVDAADRLQRAIRDEFRLDVTIGLGTSKVIAKVAAGLVKPRGLLAVAPGREAAFMAPLRVGRLPGVGPVSRRRLEELGLLTLGDIQRRGGDGMTLALGRSGGALWQRARGEDGTRVRSGSKRVSVGHQRTFGNDEVEYPVLRARARALLEEGMWRLRGMGKSCRTVEVAVRYADFTERSLHRTLPQATDIDLEVWHLAEAMLRELHRRGQAMRRIGVRFSNLVEGYHQLALVAQDRQRDRRRELLRAVDGIRETHGAHVIGYAGAAPRRGVVGGSPVARQ
jgi:DNA polymerase IV